MHDKSQAKNLVVVGNGLEAWFTAATLSSILNLNDYSITVIGHSCENTSCIESFDSTQPDPKPLVHSVRLPEDYLVARHKASFTFGIALTGWNTNDPAYFHPYSSIGAKLDTVAFHHLALRLREQGIPVRLGNFALGTLAAQANRFQRPSAQDRSVLSSCEWGVHIDTNKLSELKKTQAEKSGIEFIDAMVKSINLDDQGNISSLKLSNEVDIKADLFLDCTEQEAKLSSAWEENTWLNWSDYLPCKNRISAQCDLNNAPPPYSLAQAHNAGWIRYISLQEQTQISYYYDPNFMSQDKALEKLHSTNSEELRNITEIALSSGRRQFAWYKNCIAIGTSAVQLDPIGISNLQLLRSTLSKLAELFPKNLNSSSVVNEFNRRTSLEFENARDFALLHYKLNGRHQINDAGQNFWTQCSQNELPDILDYKLKLYQARGQVALYDEEPLQEYSWANLYDEHQIKVRNYNPLVYGFNTEDIKKHLQRVRQIMLDALGKMPTHSAYLAAVKSNLKDST